MNRPTDQRPPRPPFSQGRRGTLGAHRWAVALDFGLGVILGFGCQPPSARSVPIVVLASRKVDAGAVAAVADASHEDTQAPSPIVRFALGHARGCAVRADGHVVCWGSSPYVEDVSTRPPEQPTRVPGIEDATAISGDDDSWCALRRDHSVACFEGVGQATPIVGLTTIAEISLGCMRTTSGRVACVDASRKVTFVEGLANVVGFARGFASSCAIRADRTVVCWGSNAYGELGNNTGVDSSTPIVVKGVSAVDEVGVGRGLTCARSGTRVMCWGGEGSVGTARGRPTEKKGLGAVVELAIGEYHACVRRVDGTIACWGSNGSGQLGIPFDETAHDADFESAAIVVPGITSAEEVRVGGGEPCGGCGSTCVRVHGELVCWGAMANGTHVQKKVALELGDRTRP